MFLKLNTRVLRRDRLVLVLELESKQLALAQSLAILEGRQHALQLEMQMSQVVLG